METFTCNTCARELSRPADSIGTGYGLDEHGARHCYQCCALREFDHMVKTGRTCLYLTTTCPDAWRADHYKVSDWAGNLAFTVNRIHHHKRGGGFHGAQRTDVWFMGPDGFEWHGVNRGDMDLTRCKRTKRQSSPHPGVRREVMRRKLAAHISPMGVDQS